MAATLSAELVAASLDHLGLPPDVALPVLVDAVSVGVLAGSIAKIEAMKAGEVPPGADVSAVAERWLADPTFSWSCWATCSLLAGLARACGYGAEVVATRRIDPLAAPVDFHSLVVLDDHRGRWICDPYFGVGLVPAAAGGDFLRPGIWAECAPRGPGWSVAVGTAQWPAICRYRTISEPLHADDIEAFCRVSTTHTGVGPTRYGLRLLADGVAMAREDRDGGAVLRRWRLPGDRFTGVAPEVVAHAGLADALAELIAIDAPPSPVGAA